MTKFCVVPQCKTGSRGLKIKRSVFKVPSDSERLKKWQSAIPDRQLTSSHHVCEKHFEEHCILRKYIRHDSNGRVMAEVPYKHPRLTESAVPTIFDHQSNENTVEECDGPTIIDDIEHCGGVSPGHDFSNKSRPMDTDAAIHLKVVPMDVLVPETVLNTRSNMQPLTNTTDNADVKPHQVVASTTFDTLSVPIREYSLTARLEDGVDCVESLPVPWVVGQLPAGSDQRLVFLYPELAKKRGIEIPITGKTVTVDGQKNLRYYVHGNLVDNDQANLREKLDSLTDIPDVLVKFQHMKLCCGIGEVNIHFLPREESFLNYSDEWHHNECSLLWKKRRCENCWKLRKTIVQRERRTTNLHSRSRISRLTNSVDEQKFKMILKKMRCESRGRKRAQSRLSILQSSLKAQQRKIAAIKDETFEEWCSELLVPAAQKTAVREIIAAASTKNSKRRRYTEDWIMLCKLMNMRSPGYYEFLRKNNIMPLPSIRTIRSYCSLMNAKCGFDASGLERLEAHVETRDVTEVGLPEPEPDPEYLNIV